MEGRFGNYNHFAGWINTEKITCSTDGIQTEPEETVRRRLITQYCILYRQWNDLWKQWEQWQPDTAQIRQDLNASALRPVATDHGVIWQQTPYLLKDLLAWNRGYFQRAFGETEQETGHTYRHSYADKIIEIGKWPEDRVHEISYYTQPLPVPGSNTQPLSSPGSLTVRTKTDKNHAENILEYFFCGEQPMLNVMYFPQQERASQMLKKHKYHLLFDEVGTGKSVCALYCIRDVIARKKQEAKILIVCPGGKRKEWKHDIQRQLGLYAHCVDSSEAYGSDMKRFYFREKEPMLFIEGQTKSQMQKDLETWKDGEKWDLLVIDEGHLCFDNYETLYADRAVLLTATPVIVHTKRKPDGSLERAGEPRKLDAYQNLLGNITDSVYDEQTLWDTQPLQNLFSKSELFTQLFREDLDSQANVRKIIFLECGRMKQRQKYLDLLGYAAGGLTRLHYEQDDDLLMEGVFHRFSQKVTELAGDPGEEPVFPNEKYMELSKFLQQSEKSYIIFFHMTWTTDHIYGRLINDPDIRKENLIIAKKHGKESAMFPNMADNMLSYMQTQIKEGKRVLFLTTGQTGGTGLNLGYFHGVIHYELPFTCIELEQRFGRVDRMDQKSGQEKEMVFLLNRDEDNPMFRYSALKITETCKYLPVRNTVLFYREFIDQMIRVMKMALYLLLHGEPGKLSEEGGQKETCGNETGGNETSWNETSWKETGWKETIEELLKNRENCWRGVWDGLTDKRKKLQKIPDTAQKQTSGEASREMHREINKEIRMIEESWDNNRDHWKGLPPDLTCEEKEYLNYFYQHKDLLKEIKIADNRLYWLSKEIQNWCNLLELELPPADSGCTQDDAQALPSESGGRLPNLPKEEFVSYDVVEEPESEAQPEMEEADTDSSGTVLRIEVEEAGKNMEAGISHIWESTRDGRSCMDAFADTVHTCRRLLEELEAQKKTDAHTYTGLFYIENGIYKRQSVADFRKEHIPLQDEI